MPLNCNPSVDFFLNCQTKHGQRSNCKRLNGSALIPHFKHKIKNEAKTHAVQQYTLKHFTEAHLSLWRLRSALKFALRPGVYPQYCLLRAFKDEKRKQCPREASQDLSLTLPSIWYAPK